MRERLLQAQDTMKFHHDQKRRTMVFNVGDWAWLRLQHRDAAGITSTTPSKLRPRFYGPFKVIECIGKVSYRLQLPAKAKIHDVFHVSLLKKFEGEPPIDTVQLPDSTWPGYSYS